LLAEQPFLGPAEYLDGARAAPAFQHFGDHIQAEPEIAQQEDLLQAEQLRLLVVPAAVVVVATGLVRWWWRGVSGLDPVDARVCRLLRGPYDETGAERLGVVELEGSVVRPVMR